RWGIGGTVAISGGAGDVAAGGIGIGAVREGDGFVSLGTSAQVFVAAKEHRPDPARLVHAFCHALPGTGFRMSALLNGASVLSAASRWVGEPDIASLLSEVERGFEARGRVPGRILALPYLFGERTPHNDPTATGAIVGLTAATT